LNLAVVSFATPRMAKPDTVTPSLSTLIAGFCIAAETVGLSCPSMVRGRSTTKLLTSPALTRTISPGWAESMALCTSRPAWITSAAAGRLAQKSNKASKTGKLREKLLLLLCLKSHFISSVPEMAHAGEDHGHAVLIGGIYHLRIPHRSAGMNYGAGPRQKGLVQSVTEGEE